MFNDKIWHKYVIFGRLACVLSKETRQHGLGLQSCIWTIHKTSRTMSSEQMRPKWRCLAIKYNTTLVKTTNTSHQMSHMLMEGWRFWACLVATGTGHLTVIESGMSSSVSKSILESNVGTSVRQLKLGQEWVMQQDNDPKHTSKSTTERLEKEKNQGVAAVQLKSRPRPDSKTVARAVQKSKFPQTSINLSNAVK